MSFVLAIDQGTTGSTALVFSRQGTILGRAYGELKQYYPQPGWVEHDPEEIWQLSRRVMAQALTAAGIKHGELSAIGITNQRETSVIWDRATGQPVHRAIVWQSRQSADICQRLKAAGHEPLFRARTGLVLDAYFSGTKIRWLLDRYPQLQRRAESGELAFGTIDSWLLWKLTGGAAPAGAVHRTDPTNASRTLLYDIHKRCWDPELCQLLNVPPAMLPEVLPSAGVFGYTRGCEGLPPGVPVAGMAGDQQAALYGQACWQPGQAKNTYGTGCFLLMNMGAQHPVSQHGLLTTICCDEAGAPAYALEGSVFIAGAAVQWLRDELKIIGTAAETDALAQEIPDNEGVYLVPAFAGLGAPYWDSASRGALVGLTRGAGRAHLARAALESIAYQARDIVEVMNLDSGIELTELRVDGGASKNDFLMQFQADILGVPVDRPAQVETTAAGAAYLAGLATGLWNNPQELLTAWQPERRFTPAMGEHQRMALYAGWQEAVSRVRSNLNKRDFAAMTENQFPPITGLHDGAVTHDQGKLITADQIELAWQAWTPPASQGVIVVVHGLAEHSGRYRETAEYLANRGWAVYVADLRGHGQSSDGRHSGRVHVDQFSDYFHDVDALIGLARKHYPNLSLFLLGHSMGGLIALSYALEKPAALDGAIISSPALGTHPDSQPPLLLKLVVKVLSRLAPRLLFNSDLDTSAISRDPEVVQAYIADPLVSNKVSARWYASMMKAMDHAFDRAAALRIPLLLMQSGADRLVDPAATARWAAAAPGDYLDLVIWEGFYHEMLSEPGKDRVREKILDWLERHCSK